MKRVIAFMLCVGMVNMGLVYATELPLYLQANQECVACSEEMEELAEAMGYKAEMSADGLVIINIYTSERMLIDPEGLGLIYCVSLLYCMSLSLQVGLWIYFFPCYILWAWGCT